jgi:hypothetical protein
MLACQDAGCGQSNGVLVPLKDLAASLKRDASGIRRDLTALERPLCTKAAVKNNKEASGVDVLT